MAQRLDAQPRLTGGLGHHQRGRRETGPVAILGCDDTEVVRSGEGEKGSRHLRRAEGRSPVRYRLRSVQVAARLCQSHLQSSLGEMPARFGNHERRGAEAFRAERQGEWGASLRGAGERAEHDARTAEQHHETLSCRGPYSAGRPAAAPPVQAPYFGQTEATWMRVSLSRFSQRVSVGSNTMGRK